MAGTKLNSRGFTLLEVMISIGALAVAAITLAGGVVVSQRTSHVNGQYAQAISLCQHKIDQLRAVGFGRLNYTELNDAGIVDDNPSSSPFSFVAADSVGDYLAQPTATVTLASLDQNRTTATVTVTWHNARHLTKTSRVSLTAMITNVE